MYNMNSMVNRRVIKLFLKCLPGLRVHSALWTRGRDSGLKDKPAPPLSRALLGDQYTSIYQYISAISYITVHRQVRLLIIWSSIDNQTPFRHSVIDSGKPEQRYQISQDYSRFGTLINKLDIFLFLYTYFTFVCVFVLDCAVMAFINFP